MAHRRDDAAGGALDALEPEAFVEINPDDLSRLDLVAGDQVRVSTRRGSIELMARADHHVPLGLVFIPFCFVEAPANILTNPALDPFGKIPELKFAAARDRAMSRGGSRIDAAVQ